MPDSSGTWRSSSDSGCDQAGLRDPGCWRGPAKLTEARAEHPWLAEGSATVQQQALRDFSRAMANFFKGTHGHPTWRKAGVNEGFQVVGEEARRIHRLSRRVGEVHVPKVGWVRFRWSRQVPGAKSYRVTKDRAGRRHIAFAVLPRPIEAPGDGTTVGVDRGVKVSAALSTGELLTVPDLGLKEAERLARLHRRLAKADTAAARAVAVRGGGPLGQPVNREPQLASSPDRDMGRVAIPSFTDGRT